MAQQAFEDLVDLFALFDDWEERYRHVIEMGKTFPALDAVLKVAANKVEGCASQVWLRPRITPVEMDTPPGGATFDFEGDSDALIVRGLIAVLHALYADLNVQAVLEVDAHRELARLGLQDHLSAQRSNGVRAMVARIRAHAHAHAHAASCGS